MFSRKICEIFKNTYFKEHLRTTASSDIYHNKQLKNDSYPGLTDLKQWCIHFIFVFQENLSITESFWRIFSISCSIYLLINLWVNILGTESRKLFGEWGMTYNCFNPNLGWEGMFVKKIRRDAMLANYGVIVIFPIYQFAVIRKPDCGRMFSKTYIFTR